MSDYSVSSNTSVVPQGSARRTTAPPAMSAVENATTAVTRALAYSLSLSSPPPSPFFFPALSSFVPSNRSRAESASTGRQGKEGRGEARHIFMREGRG